MTLQCSSDSGFAPLFFPPSSLQQGHSEVLSVSFLWPPPFDQSRAQEMYTEMNTEWGNLSQNPSYISSNT